MARFLKKMELIEMVKDDLMSDQTLQYIDEEDRKLAIAMAWKTTDPKSPAIEYRLLAKSLIGLSGQVETKENRKATEQLILKVLMTRLQPDVHYAAGNQITRSTKKGIDTYRVKGDVHIVNIHSVILSGEFEMNDKLRAYIDCHHLLAVKLREYLKANEELGESKAITGTRYKAQRAQLQSDLHQVGINPKFGIGANRDKYILSRLVPGAGNQVDKIKAACGETKVSGSAMSNLNPTEMGLVDVMNARCAYAMKQRKREIEECVSPEMKRKKCLEVFKGVVDGFGKLTYEGATEEENAEMMYNKKYAVQTRVLDHRENPDNGDDLLLLMDRA